MEIGLGGMLIGALTAGLALYAFWTVAEAIHYANLRHRIKRRRDAGYDPICRVDENGNVYTVRATGEHGDTIPEFLRRPSQN